MGLNIDELSPDNDRVTEQVEAIKRTHGSQFPPNYALSWVIANQVIQRFYGRLGLDAIPVWRDNFGWSQITITRASNCLQPQNKGEESLRYIMFDAISVNWTGQESGKEANYDAYSAIWDRHLPPAAAVEEAVAHLSLENQEAFDHSGCLHGPLAYAYTKLFQVMTDLICRAPEAVGKREITIDIDPFGNTYDEPVHPLRKTDLAEAGTTRDWFELFHIPANSRIFVHVFTGDIVRTEPDDTPRVLDYPGWNERNDEQLRAYFAEMLAIPL